MYPQNSFVPEPGSCQILLVRHGQSEPYIPERPFNLIDGHGDPHLTELGRHQADMVAKRLKAEPIGAIYVSSLTRTHQTAAPLADALSLTPVIEPDLREVYLGDFEGGLFRKHAADGHPAVESMRAKRQWSEIPGAETNENLVARTSSVLSGIAANHSDELVVVVCHGGVIAALVGYVTGAHPFVFNGSRHTAISHLVASPAGWLLRSFNDAQHMGTVTMDNGLPMK